MGISGPMKCSIIPCFQEMNANIMSLNVIGTDFMIRNEPFAVN